MRNPALALALVALLPACAYGPDFRRDTLREPRHAPIAVVHADPRLRVAVGRCDIRDKTEERLFVRLCNALRANADVATVLPAEAPPGSYDARLHFHVERDARTTPVNFVIAWPGVLIDAPYWHGFEWPYVVRTTVQLVRADGSLLAERTFIERYMCYYTPGEYSAPLALSLPTATIAAFWVGWVASTVEQPPDLESMDRKFAKDEGPFWARRIVEDVVHQVIVEGSAAPAPSERPVSAFPFLQGL